MILAYTLLIFLGTVSLGCILFTIYMFVQFLKELIGGSVDGCIIPFIIYIAMIILTGLSLSATSRIYDGIKERKVHPCIQWSNYYDQGQLGQYCIKRKP